MTAKPSWLTHDRRLPAITSLKRIAGRAWDARTFPMVALTDALGRAEASSRRRLRLADHVIDRERYVPNPP
jgi:hypothetical protein